MYQTDARNQPEADQERKIHGCGALHRQYNTGYASIFSMAKKNKIAMN